MNINQAIEALDRHATNISISYSPNVSSTVPRWTVSYGGAGRVGDGRGHVGEGQTLEAALINAASNL